MRILFLSHYFPPEVNAPAGRTYEHCVRWAAAGHDVTVVTCAPNCPDGVVYDGYRNRLRRQVETVDGIRVVRVWTYLAPNAGTIRRIANYVSYMISATLASIRLPRPDVIVATSPQFFCGWAGVLVHWLRRIPFVLEIRDIWPESIETVGAIRNRPLLQALEWLERRMYRAADHIVAVGNGYRDKIIEKADVADRISVITNGVDLRRFRAEGGGRRAEDGGRKAEDGGRKAEDGEQGAAISGQQPHHSETSALQAGLPDQPFVCSYVGTIGMAHGLDVVVQAAKILKAAGRRDVVFQLVGDGAHRAALQEAVRQAGVDDLVVFTGRQPKEMVPQILAGSDACLIHLRKCELFGTVLPSKIFETMAMGRPIIMGVKGEALDLVLQAGAGVAMEPEDPQSLLAAVDTLAEERRAEDGSRRSEVGGQKAEGGGQEPEVGGQRSEVGMQGGRWTERGRAAREFVTRHYDRDVLAARYLELLQFVVLGS